jgi:hypothetical protein
VDGDKPENATDGRDWPITQGGTAANDPAVGDDQPRRAAIGRAVTPAEHRVDLRQKLVELALRLAETEDEVVRSHEDMASRNPERAAEYQQHAELAREGAKRARQIARLYSD